jgi:hypothetical protein
LPGLDESLLFVIARGDLVFGDWWNNWDLTRPPDETQEVGRPIIILRRV